MPALYFVGDCRLGPLTVSCIVKSRGGSLHTHTSCGEFILIARVPGVLISRLRSHPHYWLAERLASRTSASAGEQHSLAYLLNPQFDSSSFTSLQMTSRQQRTRHPGPLLSASTIGTRSTSYLLQSGSAPPDLLRIPRRHREYEDSPCRHPRSTASLSIRGTPIVIFPWQGATRLPPGRSSLSSLIAAFSILWGN
jgi:hypothetical protein